MKPKKKLCDGCGFDKPIWKNHEGKKYCKYCWSKQTVTTGVAKKKTVKKQYKIPSRSPKRAKQEREYGKLRKKFLEQNPICQMKLPNICTHQATDVHHTAGRIGDLLTDVRYWKGGCRACHTWVELHPKEAKEMGLSINRLNLD